MGVSARYRDKSGEIGRKYGDTLNGTLRISYGSRFAKGCTDDEKLSEALAKLDKASLSKLVRDHSWDASHKAKDFPAGSAPRLGLRLDSLHERQEYRRGKTRVE
jgi:hypothetical protein